MTTPSAPRVPRLFGHPLHSVFVHFPVALLLLPLPLDVAGWIFDRAWCWEASRGCLILGLFAAGIAAATGFMDYATVPAESPALRVANRHMVVMLCTTVVFVADVLVRVDSTVPQGGWRVLAVALSALGAGALSFGGWLGGELVYRHGVGQTREKPAITVREEN